MSPNNLSTKSVSMLIVSSQIIDLFWSRERRNIWNWLGENGTVVLFKKYIYHFEGPDKESVGWVEKKKKTYCKQLYFGMQMLETNWLDLDIRALLPFQTFIDFLSNNVKPYFRMGLKVLEDWFQCFLYG